MRHLKNSLMALVGVIALTALAGIGTASATTIWKDTNWAFDDKLGVGTKVFASLESGSSFTIQSTGGQALTTCTESEFELVIENGGGEFSDVSGSLQKLAFRSCSQTTHVLYPGTMKIQHIPKTNQGLVTAEAMEITVQSPFGHCVAKTAGTMIGTLTGAASEKAFATLHVTGVVKVDATCGTSATFVGNYSITTPTGFYVWS